MDQTDAEESASLAEVDAAVASQANKSETMPRKSSMKDLTGRLSQKANGTTYIQETEGIGHVQLHDEVNACSQISSMVAITDQPKTIRSQGTTTTAKKGRRHSEHSLLAQQAKRMGDAEDNFTSAFLIPDITMHIPKVTTGDPSTGPHEPVNCTICRASIQPSEDHTNCRPLPTLSVPVPVPVSTRMPLPTTYEEEPTIRPSQPPPQALANVIKSCEDELAHLKLQLAKYQELYNRHDPSLSKRERKRVCEKVKEILAAIERKADMIYGLYDVLEGQKEVQEVIVGGERVVIRGGEGTTQEIGAESANEDGQSCQSNEGVAEHDLPWEGIENTFPTLSSITGMTRRSRKSL